MRTCEEYRELISLAIDNEITPEDMVELQRHLLECDECRLVYDAFMSISGSLSDELAQPPEGFAQNVMFRIGHEQPARRKRSVWKRFAAIAACFVILAATASGIGLNRWKNGSAADNAPKAVYASADTAPEYSEADEEASLFDLHNSDAAAARDESQNSAPDAMEPDAPLVQLPAEEPASDVPADGVLTSEAPEDSSAQLSPEDEMTILMSLTEAEIYTGELSDTGSVAPDVSTTNSEALAALANLLSFSELTGEDVPDGEPLFTIIGRISENEEIKIPIWLSDNSLVIQLGEDGPIYIANGTLVDLLEFIKNA